MTVDSKDLFSKWILRRAWALINSSTELPYKNFVRSLFASYSINARENIDSLFSRLKNNTYEPTPPCRLYSPKQSGILRPYSLLTTDDQIVYQAFAIWIANALSKRVCRRYYKTVFSHIYAGQSARFFYRPWKLGYDLLNKSIRRSHAEGFAWFATFDLTAFYDSIDHTILRKSLEILRLDKDYISLLCNDWLPIWTTSHPKEQWIQGHGLPQSPLASGLLAESVMRHFDEVLEKWKSIKYYRYVDDIKIMARDERTLRLALVKLDLRSKELGLFPQVSKIQPRHVTIIDSELKNIHFGYNEVLLRRNTTQYTIKKRLYALSKRYIILDETKFKYELSYAQPFADVCHRLITLLYRYPHLYLPVFAYIEKYKIIPASVSNRIVSFLGTHDEYHSLLAEAFRVLSARIHPSVLPALLRLAKKWKSRYTADIKAYANIVLLQHKQLSACDILK